MFNPIKMLIFGGRVLRLALPFVLFLLVLSVFSEWFTYAGDADLLWLDPEFWLQVVVDVVPGIILGLLVFWLAARFVRSLYNLDNWRAGLGFLLRSRSGMWGFSPWVKVHKGMIDKEDSFLKRSGGPGNLVVYNDSAVVLELKGRLERIVGAGFQKLEAFETGYGVVDLRPKREVLTVEAMTAEGIRIDWDVEIQYQIDDGGEELGEDTPYPLSKDKVLQAATTRWVMVDGSSVLDWEALLTRGLVTGELRNILARKRLNDLVGLGAGSAPQNARPARQAVQQELEANVRQAALGLGAKVLDIRLDKFRVKDEVTQQWIENWRTRWRRWSEEGLAESHAAQIRLYETTKAEAQASLIAYIGHTVEDLATRDRVVPRVLLARLFSALDRAAFRTSSRIFFPAEAFKALETMKQLMSGDSDGAAGDG
ncbi:MAG: SPFH domain-containing protein [Anaerolineae bacterium]|nr:SPFH domain-containing protein [Anaerolineae bacterium]